MQQMESRLGVSTFFMMDENFLLHRPRALPQLLERMKEHNKSWGLAVFASANAIPQIHHARTRGTGSVMDMDGA